MTVNFALDLSHESRQACMAPLVTSRIHVHPTLTSKLPCHLALAFVRTCGGEAALTKAESFGFFSAQKVDQALLPCVEPKRPALIIFGHVLMAIAVQKGEE